MQLRFAVLPEILFSWHWGLLWQFPRTLDWAGKTHGTMPQSLNAERVALGWQGAPSEGWIIVLAAPCVGICSPSFAAWGLTMKWEEGEGRRHVGRQHCGSLWVPQLRPSSVPRGHAFVTSWLERVWGTPLRCECLCLHVPCAPLFKGKQNNPRHECF